MKIAKWHHRLARVFLIIAMAGSVGAAKVRAGEIKADSSKMKIPTVNFPVGFTPMKQLLEHHRYLGFRMSRGAVLPERKGIWPVYVIRMPEGDLPGNQIQAGDVLLGVAHQPLGKQPVNQFKKAVFEAIRTKSKLWIMRWRAGKITTLNFDPRPAPPDLTQPEARKKVHNQGRYGPHTWPLGATGARGWMWANRNSTDRDRQILITKVDAGSPADGVLKPDDVILGIGGKLFSSDARIAFGKALTQAETKAGGGKLPLIRWRDGKTSNVIVHIQVMGSYGPTAPYDSPKSALIVKQGCEAIAREMAKNDYTKHHNPIVRCLNAMALLGSGQAKYLPLVKKEATWASNYSANSFQTWWYGYCMMFLSEYVNDTGDQSVMPGLKRLALAAANGQSIVGSWGHRFAGPDGLCQGYGMMNAAGLPLTIGLVEARKVGVTDPAVSRAIKRSAELFQFYIGKGSIPYGDHRPWMGSHSSNGKNGMAALLFDLLGNKQGATFFSRMGTAGYGKERDGGHTGNFFNLLWAMPGIALSGPHATGAWMTKYGHWYFDLARRWDGTFVYEGEPTRVGSNGKYYAWDSTGAYVLAYEMPLHKLWFTGKQPSVAPQVTAEQAHQLIVDGQSGEDPTYFDKMSLAQLIDQLSNWSPIVRLRAAQALNRRSDVPIKTLVKMLHASDLKTQLGACVALEQLGEKAAPAAATLGKLLDAKQLWLRIKAADALAVMGQPGMAALPKMLKMMAQGPTKQDPRNMQQRYLMFAVFGKMLKNSLHGVDPQLLREAVAAGLTNQDGRARGEIGNIYKQLDYDQIKPLLPAIRDATAKSAPSGIMFAANIRIAGLKVLAKYHIKQGMDLCLQVMEPNKWGQGYRIPKCLAILAEYGAAAKPLLPELRVELAKFKKSRDRRNTKILDAFRHAIKTIENATSGPKLRNLPSAAAS